MNTSETTTARDHFFVDIADAKKIIIMTYTIDSLLNRLPSKLKKNTCIICPNKERKKVNEMGFPLENIYHIPENWHRFEITHGKIFIKIFSDKITTFLGSNNFTYAGMETNFETYIAHTTSIGNVSKTIEKLEINDLKHCIDDEFTKDVLDFLTHLMDNIEKRNLSSEQSLNNDSKTFFFIHSVGNNSLLNSYRYLLKNDNIDKIRIISPYVTSNSLEKMLHLIRQNTEKPIKLEILTNYLPDFKGNYNTSSFIDTTEYVQIRKNWKEQHNINIEMRFWDSDGLNDKDIPGNFIHSKLFFVCNTKKCTGMILSSANLSSSAWTDNKTIETGILELDERRIREVYEFYDEIYFISRGDGGKTLHEIETVRHKLAQTELVSSIPFKRFVFENSPFSGKSYRQVKKPSTDLKTLSIFQLKQKSTSKFMNDFLNNKIEVITNEFSPKIEGLSLEVLYQKVTDPNSRRKKKDYKFNIENDNLFSLNFSLLKDDLNIDYTIESFVIKANTNALFDDILIRTKDWEKVISEDILSIDDDYIIIEEIEEYFPMDLSQLTFKAFLLLKNKTHVILDVKSLEQGYVIETPKSINQTDIYQILIRAIKPKIEPKILSYYQPNLKFHKTPFKNISIENASIEKNQFHFLVFELDETFLKFDESDFIFKINNKEIFPLITFQKQDSYHFLFDEKKSKITITLKNHLNQYFDEHLWTVEYSCDQNLEVLEKKREQINANIDLLISPEIINEKTPIAINLQQREGNKIEIDYSTENKRMNFFERPQKIISDNDEQIIISKLYPGQEIFVKTFYILKNIRLHLHNKIIKVKKKLIDDVVITFPFNNHYRDMDLKSQSYGKRYVDCSHFLFSIKVDITKGEIPIEKCIANIKLKFDDDTIPFHMVKSNYLRKDSLLIFFKRNCVNNDIKEMIFNIYFETFEPYSDFEKKINLNIIKTDNEIILETINDKKVIKDGYEKTIDEYPIIHHILLENNIIEKPNNTRFNRYGLGNDRKKILDSREDIFPVWFIN